MRSKSSFPFTGRFRKKLPLKKIIESHPLDWGGQKARLSVRKGWGDSDFACFIEKNDYYDCDFLYGTPAGDYPDNGERFSFFSKAPLETLRVLGFAPDIIHAHDWQSAIALACLKFIYGGCPLFKNTHSLFTIHNLAYQGLFEKSILNKIGLPDSLFNSEELEFYGKVNFLKAEILYATAVNTVSPRYSQEIRTPEFGSGLDGLLRKRQDGLSGILNGVDYSVWDPAHDSFLAANYSAADLKGKAACKKDLLETVGLPPSVKDVPVIGMVSRCGGQMKVIAFITDFSVVDRIINHLKLTFVASKPPPPQVAFQELLMAAEASAEYFL